MSKVIRHAISFKWLQKLEAKTNTSLTLLGEVVGIINGIFSGQIDGPNTTVTATQSVLSSLAAILQNLDQLGVVLPPGVDFTRAYVAKHLGNVPDDPGGGRNAWITAAQKAAAVDASGNLLLKNISHATSATSNPTTSSTTAALLPDMSIPITTKGNKVYTSWAIGFRTSTLGGTTFFQIYRDGTGIGPIIEGTSPNNVGQNSSVAASWIDSPSAGAHTYEVWWWTTSGTTATADLTNRTMECLELG